MATTETNHIKICWKSLRREEIQLCRLRGMYPFFPTLERKLKWAVPRGKLLAFQSSSQWGSSIHPHSKKEPRGGPGDVPDTPVMQCIRVLLPTLCEHCSSWQTQTSPDFEHSSAYFSLLTPPEPCLLDFLPGLTSPVQSQTSVADY